MKRFFGAKFTSTLSIALVLFVLGLMTLGGLVAAHVARELRERFTVTITVSDVASTDYGQRLVKKLNKAKYTADAIYVSADSALRVLQTELGENPADFLGYNPLSPTVELKLKAEYAEADSIEMIVKELKRTQGSNIAAIDYNNTLLDMVNANLRRFAIVLAVVLALGLFMALPAGVESLMIGAGASPVAYTLVGGLLKILLLLGYMILCGFVPDVRRTFQYHGAEHKTVHCHESGKPLTPEKTEKALAAIVEPAEQAALCHRFVMFGREVCCARSPHCCECILSDICENRIDTKDK